MEALFSDSTNGSYVKMNSYSQNKRTPSQTIQQNKIVLASQAWRTLTNAQKADYAAEVINYPYVNRLGDTVYYTAFQLFQFLNQNNVQNGQPILAAAPAFTALVADVFTVSENPSNVLIFGTASGTAGQIATLFVTKQFVSGVTPPASEYKKLISLTLTGGSQSIGIETEYETMFGNLIIGKNIWYKYKLSVAASGNTSDFSEPQSYAPNYG